jgi:hypothetical protein
MGCIGTFSKSPPTLFFTTDLSGNFPMEESARAFTVCQQQTFDIVMSARRGGCLRCITLNRGGTPWSTSRATGFANK